MFCTSFLCAIEVVGSPLSVFVDFELAVIMAPVAPPSSKYFHFMRIQEFHNNPIYCIAINDIDPVLSGVFATAAKNQVSL